MEIIIFESQAFYALLQKVQETIRSELKQEEESPWVSPSTAMSILGIKSKTTLKKMRDEGMIKYSCVAESTKLFMYDKNSLFEHLNKNAREPF